MKQRVFDNSVWHGYKEFHRVCETIKGRYGTGGNNVPLVLTYQKSRRAKDRDDFETWVEGGIANTLNTFEGGGHESHYPDSKK